MDNNRNGGYIGLVVLLVSLVIVALLFVRLFLTPRTPDSTTSTSTPSIQPQNQDGTVPRTQYDQYRADIDAARNVQDVVQPSVDLEDF